jgi:hypothetical protein
MQLKDLFFWQKESYQKIYSKLFLNPVEFKPEFLSTATPPNYANVVSAWKGLEQIIPAIIKQFNLPTNKCLEFGVDNGYSSAIFSNYFTTVLGVDYFEGDIHAGVRNVYEQTKQTLAPFKNITVQKNSYQNFIKDHHEQYDLIHVDIIHNYEHTYACGLWAAEHSKCAIFHDTESFFEVRKAVHDIAKKTGKTFYNYPHHYGLGIIC